MDSKIDLKKLKSSWTKFDAVQVIEMVSNNEIEDYISGTKEIDKPILRSFLGIKNLNDPIPKYWNSIQEYPKQLRLFAFIAALFTHFRNVKEFALNYSKKGQMGGIYEVESGKVGTNIRRALVISGAALENYKREENVPFSFSPLFEEGDVGLLMKNLLRERLLRIGYDSESLDIDKNFIDACKENFFIRALGLTDEQFNKWINGENLNIHDERFQFKQLKIYKKIPMLKVNQWLNEWDDVDFKSELRRKPLPYFYLFSIDARLLKKISDVHRRKSIQKRSEDTSIQRELKSKRLDEIRSFIEHGFPLSTFPKEQQISQENMDLKMPGILSTAIIANIIGKGEERNGNKLNPKDKIEISEDAEKGKNFTISYLNIPDHIFENPNWDPKLKPIEIIDGQHRLWAFDESQLMSGNFELPVVAFNNLDRAWQAYLFYTINIKPVKINASLGFDLIPLLRVQKWLEKYKEGLLAYRETRSQEIVESLWIYRNSPWFQRINMLGDAGGPLVSQAGFVRALGNSFFKKDRGLFSDKINENYLVISWNRIQQAAFVILFWQKIAEAVKDCDKKWAKKLRNETKHDSSEKLDSAFTSKNSFLAREMGVRGLLTFSNDFFYSVASSNDIDFNLFELSDEVEERSINEENLDDALVEFNKNKILINLISDFANQAMEVDWRTPSASFSNEEEKEPQLKYKGSSGYREIWNTLYHSFSNSAKPSIKKYATYISKLI